MNAITPVVIKNTLPTTIIAMTGEIVQHIRSLEHDAKLITSITNQDAYDAANLIVSQANRLAKEIEEERKRLKKPVLDLGRSLDDAAGEAIAPLAGIKVDLGEMILAFQKAENARRQAEFERQQEAARKAAAEARAKAEAEESARAALPADAPPDDTPPPDDHPVHIPEVMTPAPPRMMKSYAVTSRILKDLVIDNADLIPRTLNGAELLTPNEKVIKKLLEAGVNVPGCRLAERPIIAGK